MTTSLDRSTRHTNSGDGMMAGHHQAPTSTQERIAVDTSHNTLAHRALSPHLMTPVDRKFTTVVALPGRQSTRVDRAVDNRWSRYRAAL